MEKEPPLTTERSGCAWEIVGDLEAWWEVTSFGGNAPHPKWCERNLIIAFRMSALHPHP